MKIERKSLREQVRDELVSRLHSGSVQPGDSINEVQLAAELGVSRTPLREALIGLESEGQITSESGHGFRFAKLTSSEFEELAPIIAALEALALELTDPAALTTIAKKLSEQAQEFKQSRAKHKLIVERDVEWHRLMLSACPNLRLLELIENVRWMFHRYEALLVADEEMLERSAAEHQKIAECLSSGDLSGAKRALELNWVQGAARVLERSVELRHTAEAI